MLLLFLVSIIFILIMIIIIICNILFTLCLTADYEGFKPLPMTPKNLLTPLRAALAKSQRQREEGSRQPASAHGDTPTQESDDTIGPLTPVTELANNQLTSLSDEEKRCVVTSFLSLSAIVYRKRSCLLT